MLDVKTGGKIHCVDIMKNVPSLNSCRSHLPIYIYSKQYSTHMAIIKYKVKKNKKKERLSRFF